ncbi:hypothetical protein BZG36_02456 [Bifiguratus adelaidae]|uniref:Uncharacterized protein n=1 Tax=Bifiguratus adelaidae TaxID=1938954 RepID=A0A261Y3M0_9FUNG|nr:hypothetical protein BZG36_02456 [Bifiguratus adelaidae]
MREENEEGHVRSSPYSRRQLRSNAERYEESESEGTDDDETVDRETQDFAAFLSKDADRPKLYDPSAYFSFKSALDLETDSMLAIDLSALESSLHSLDLTSRLFLGPKDAHLNTAESWTAQDKPIVPRLIQTPISAADLSKKKSAPLRVVQNASPQPPKPKTNSSPTPRSRVISIKPASSTPKSSTVFAKDDDFDQFMNELDSASSHRPTPSTTRKMASNKTSKATSVQTSPKKTSQDDEKWLDDMLS